MVKSNPVGRPYIGAKPRRVTLDDETVARLKKIDSNLSKAIRIAAKQYQAGDNAQCANV